MIYDLIIIGGGPAGTAAAVYAARKQLKTLIITPEWGGQSVVSTLIYNWIGTPEISGEQLAANFKKHVEYYRGEFLDIIDTAKVTKIEKKDSDFVVTLDNGTTHEAKSVLIASGSNRKKLEAKNADVFENKGITYCASCDGPLFAGQDVVVVGGGNAGFESALQLLAYCKSVTMLHRSEAFRADEITVNKTIAHTNFKVIKNVEILEVKGDKFVSGIVFKDKIGGETTELPVTGIFVEVGQIPNTDFVNGVVELDHDHIKVDPRNNRTSVDGIWAAGDVTDGLYHQNNIATGDAVKAVEDLYIYLKKK